MHFINKVKNKKTIISKWVVLSLFVCMLLGSVVPMRVYGAGCTPAETAAGARPQPFPDGAGGTITVCLSAEDQAKAEARTQTMQDVLSGWIFSPLARGVGYLLTVISSAILSLSGRFFDFVVNYSIVEMATNLGNPEGLGGSITDTWKTLRDIANMFFIFALLFTAFKAMFSLSFGNVGKSILNIVIVALLINFSLFFSKVVIDASNIVALGFYNQIVTSGAPATGTPQGEGEGATTATGIPSISSGYMRLLGLNSWFYPTSMNVAGDSVKVMTIGIMMSTFLLITAVVFFIAGAMFVSRFVLLIFIMLLSPLAAIAYIMPNGEGYFKKWWSALIDQSFFAPIFFGLIWVVFRLASAPNFITGGSEYLLRGDGTATFVDLATKAPNAGSMALVLNYFILIGFTIAALVISKQMASKTAYFTAITGAIGTGAMGGAAFAGRQTLGRGANAAMQSSWLRNKASSSGLGGVAARASLWTANKGAGGSFDARGIDSLKKVPGIGKELDIFGKAGGKGGFSKAVSDKAETKAKYAKAVYGQLGGEDEKAKVLGEEYNVEKEADFARVLEERRRKAGEASTVYESQKKKTEDYVNNSTRLKPLNDTLRVAEQELKNKKEAHEQLKKTSTDKVKIFESEKDLERKEASVNQAKQSYNTERTNFENTDENYKKMKMDESKVKIAMDTAERKARDTNIKNVEDTEFNEEVKKKQTEWLNVKKAGENRMVAYADRLERGAPVSTGVGATTGVILGTVFGGPIGTVVGAGVGAGVGNVVGGKLPKFTNWRGNTEAGKKVRAAAIGKDKRDPKKATEQFLKDMGIKAGEGDDDDKKDDKKEGGGEDKKDQT